MNSFALVFCALFAAVVATHHYDQYNHAPAFYKFEYGVHDPHTGDIKSQHEHRDGDVVKGGYSFKEADGTTRVVEYVAGPHSGFNAVVKKIGHAQHPAHYGHAHGVHHGGLGGLGGGYGGLGGGYGGHGGSSYVGPTHFGYGVGHGGYQGHGGYGYY